MSIRDFKLKTRERKRGVFRGGGVRVFWSGHDWSKRLWRSKLAQTVHDACNVFLFCFGFGFGFGFGCVWSGLVWFSLV